MTREELNQIEQAEIEAWKAYKKATDEANRLNKLWLIESDKFAAARAVFNMQEFNQTTKGTK